MGFSRKSPSIVFFRCWYYLPWSLLPFYRLFFPRALSHILAEPFFSFRLYLPNHHCCWLQSLSRFCFLWEASFIDFSVLILINRHYFSVISLDQRTSKCLMYFQNFPKMVKYSQSLQFYKIQWKNPWDTWSTLILWRERDSSLDQVLEYTPLIEAVTCWFPAHQFVSVFSYSYDQRLFRFQRDR